MKSAKHYVQIMITMAIAFATLAGGVSLVHAEDAGNVPITFTIEGVECGNVDFSISWDSFASVPYTVFLDFGNGESTEFTTELTSISHSYAYLVQGDYPVYAKVSAGDDYGSHSEILTIGPVVELSSMPSPPMFIVGDDGQVDFDTYVFGGTMPYYFEWDLDGDGTPETGEEGPAASFAYTDVGKYTAKVTVTDKCGFSDEASLTVVVGEENDICHPMAQKIADGLKYLLPEQKEGDYTCEDIYALFDNEEEENNLGFGRMWMAYKLAESIELTWEEILAWHLDESGWGTLLQLNRFAELLEEQGIGDLVALVISEDYTMNDVRTAARTVTRYEADFEDALDRIADGSTPGELTQFYKLAGDLEADPEILDGYLADGLTLAELKHSASFAEKMDADWIEIADLRTDAESWGDINQAYRLADDETSALEILDLGVQEYRASTREDAKTEKGEQQAQKSEEKNQQTAEKLAEQYSAESGDILSLLNGECNGDWACVRSALREQTRETAEGFSDKDYQTAQQIASKYGSSEDQVLDYHKEYCNLDWSCTRSYFRNLFMENRETGKSKK